MPAQQHGIPLPHRDRFASAWLDPNLTVKALSHRYGVSRHTIKVWAKQMGLAPRNTRGSAS